jgi:hypothetical protein
MGKYRLTNPDNNHIYDPMIAPDIWENRDSSTHAPARRIELDACE